MASTDRDDEALGDLASAVEQFYRDTTAETRRYRYLTLDGGPYTYVFDRTTGSHVVTDIIIGNSLTRRVASQFVVIAARFPRLAAVLPRIGTIELVLPAETPPNVLIGKQERVVSLNPTTASVSKIPLDNPESIIDELTARKQLPDSLPVPRLLDADYEYPYLIEEYVRGETPPMDLESLPFVCRALEGLQPLYRQDATEISTQTLLEDGAQDETGKELREWLSTYDLPNSVYEATVHRDLTPRNLGGTDQIYVLDWESSRRDYVFVDMLQWLHAVAAEQNSPETFSSLVTQTGQGPRVTSKLHDAVGAVTYDQDTFPPGLPLLYLFTEYSHRRPKKRTRLERFIEQVTPRL